MILVWLVFAVMTLVTAVLLALPLFYTRKVKNEAGFALAVYRDQMVELGRDAEAGLIAPDQARLAQIEIERRVLALTDNPQWQPGRAPSHGLLIVAAVVLPLLGFGFYLLIGAPDLPAQPFIAEHAAPAATSPELQALEADVTAKPTDAKAWVALAAGYDAAGRAQDAATAYGKAVALGAQDAATLSAYGQAQLIANRGEMNDAAAATFHRALAVDPTNPTARFFLALGKAQAGEVEGALTDWMALEKDTPQDAPWRATLEAHIAKAAERLGKPAPAGTADAASGAAATAPGPSAADIEAAQAMSPEQQQTFINDMVGRLAEKLKSNPDDLDGWVRLARAYQVLQRSDDARNAWAKAAALAPARLDVQLDYADAIIAGRSDLDRYLPPEFVEAVGRVRTLDPKNPLGLYYGGLVARVAGDKAEARRLWNDVLDQLPPDAPQRAELQKELDSLLP
ncbi:c-type cytochrome biogenesis protein CcmI [Dongia rigui]|uniref:C-type cytochrome biogenesis protein CcmI n=1 Tax=Dongia rigui TaxID=940149 RepID=A0ABU5DWA2_9PROT|nr:c-type cytochrome biogenesis protein CcmI [Dongia rigui]MDY0871554.1 c-type cytochrome biogenesis protein CcmI [Dongia rigui]